MPMNVRLKLTQPRLLLLLLLLLNSTHLRRCREESLERRSLLLLVLVYLLRAILIILVKINLSLLQNLANLCGRGARPSNLLLDLLLLL